ncbi:hypothetical protein [Butyrivibrio proteoclasticus]|uniref:hypothetical protein n=1 Tax=Butyrivibrio proteoclasticus TaxID=43305 RepID=UPI0012DF0DAC|nr:hypothetical protein [Butyrivibrio proteoclasticus]
MDNWLSNKKSKLNIYSDDRLNMKQPVLWCFFVALLTITLCSRSSFLYAFNLWDDANSYFTMGRSMFRGMVPYRDLFDQKGYILYAIYGVASLISPTTFIGVYVFEVLAAFVALLSIFLILNLYLGKGYLPYIGTALSSAVIYSSLCFWWGGSAEEFLFPCICLGMYLSLRYFREGYPEAMSYGTVLFGGFLAGVVFHIKFNSLGFFFAWMMMVFFADLIGAKAVAKAFISCFVFLFGMVIATVPGIIYFGVNGSIGSWAYVYLYKNIFEYSKSLSLLERFAAIYDIMTDHMYSNPICYLLIFVGAVYFTVALFSKFIKENKFNQIKRNSFLIEVSVFEYLNIVALLTFLILVIFAGGVTLMYYPFPINAFAVFGLVAVGKLMKGLYRLMGWARGKRESQMLFSPTGPKTVLVLLTALAISVAIILGCSVNVRTMSVKKKDLWLFKFRDYIASQGVNNPKLLNMYGFDTGLYTVTNADPVCYYYQTQTLNMDEVLEVQYGFIREGKVDFVVSCEQLDPADVEGYELVLHDNIDIYRFSKEYYLYERVDLVK